MAGPGARHLSLRALSEMAGSGASHDVIWRHETTSRSLLMEIASPRSRRQRDSRVNDRGYYGGATRNVFEELKIQVSMNPVSFGLRSSALNAPVRHIQLRISC